MKGVGKTFKMGITQRGYTICQKNMGKVLTKPSKWERSKGVTQFDQKIRGKLLIKFSKGNF